MMNEQNQAEEHGASSNPHRCPAELGTRKAVLTSMTPVTSAQMATR
jgi:hypothetical protein